MRATKRSLSGAVLLGLIAIVCWAYALTAARGLARQYAGVSVRLTEASITRQTLEKAQEQADDGEMSCTAAWTRSAVKQTADSQLGGKTYLRVVRVYGDMRQTEPMKLLSGVLPAEDDTDGCLIDTASAWALFHSTDAIGAVVTAGEHDYIVRGIAETYEPALMIRDDKAAYENLEFSTQSHADAKQSVETLLTRCGSGGGYAIVQSGLLARVLLGLAWTPVWIAMACTAAAFLKRGWNRRVCRQQSIAWRAVGAALLALACFGLASTAFWPQSLLPTKWSDFAFWGRLIESWRTETKTFALMTQLPKEIELFSTARRCAAALIVSIFSGGWCGSAARRVLQISYTKRLPSTDQPCKEKG